MTTAQQAEGLEQVLVLADHGWLLLPCAERGKVPLIGDWRKRASSDPDTIQRWAKKHGRCNWAVATGQASGVFVIDVDGESGEKSFCSLIEQHGTWSKTLATITARGHHFYFDWPTSGTIRTSAGKLGSGVDVRGDGGYCVIPPSLHPSGARYEWTGNSKVASAPDWLLRSLTSASGPVIDSAEIGTLLEGTRNDGLTRYAGKLRRGGADQAEIELKLLAANRRRCKPPLSEDEVRKIAAGIVMRYAPGGLDPLERAWQASEGDYSSNYERFLALARELQSARPGQTIALPLERIGALMRVHWNSVSYYRSKAVASEILCPAGDYVPHRKAALYRCSETIFVTKDLKGLVTKNPLVTKPLNPPSYKDAWPLVTKPSERENLPEPHPNLDGLAWRPPNFTELRSPQDTEELTALGWRTTMFCSQSASNRSDGTSSECSGVLAGAYRC